ncbi:hypothetical protein U9M48_001074 [Paspalum notatum var. saurae]|uniref:Uncharacterized protein n=1 Tax=Paspalum notatum var. saurae TaxID=547442 RepID=A0AAQ3PNN4_PASNO
MLENRRFGNKDAPTIQVAVVGLGYNGTALAVTIAERLKNTGTVKAINAQATICPAAPRGIRDAYWRVIKSRNVDLLFGYSVSSIRESRRPDQDPNITATTNSQTVNDEHQKLILELNPVQSGLKGETLEADLAAFEQAHLVAWNIWAAINGRPLSPFRFQKFGEFMSLGRTEAAISVDFVEGLTLEGPAAHAARKLAYCVRMPTQEHRAKVGMSWFAKALMDSLAS